MNKSKKILQYKCFSVKLIPLLNLPREKLETNNSEHSKDPSPLKWKTILDGRNNKFSARAASPDLEKNQ